MERYDVGDRVVSNVDAQGMRRGEAFEVVARDERGCSGTATRRSRCEPWTGGSCASSTRIC
jgi:hypothetical protein